jgi:hypothetical protein
MATYYVWSGATGGSNTGGSWTNAFLTYAQGVTAATADGDIIKVHAGHVEALAADTTYSFGANVRTICVNKDSSDALAQMDGSTQYIGHTSSGRSILIAGANRDLYFYGMAFIVKGSDKLVLAAADGMAVICENCYLKGGQSDGGIAVGNTDCQVAVTIRGGSVVFDSITGCYINLRGDLTMQGVTVLPGGATLATGLIAVVDNDPGGVTALFDGCDFSALGGTVAVKNCTSAAGRFVFSNCRFGSSWVGLDTQTNLNRSSAEVWFFNCASDDQHYHIAHYNSLGQTTVDTGIYANDNITDTALSWKIVTTANCSFYDPYESPWLPVYHVGTSAITPYLECVRSGSSTAFQNDEVWSEWSYQGTSGYPQATLVLSDRMTPLGTPADQTASSKGASDWTGENATSWFGKLGPAASFTPAEVGHIRARVCVGEPSTTVYVDPQIRGLS